MSSAPVFKVPYPPPPKYLISQKDINDIQGKIRCLNKIMKHPRAAHPEISAHLHQLLATMYGLINSNVLPYNELNRKMTDFGMKSMVLSEELVIRYVVKEESLQVVIQQQMERIRATGMFDGLVFFPPPKVE